MGIPEGQKIDAEALKARRVETRRLLDKGVAQTEAARRVLTFRQSISHWAQTARSELSRCCRQGRKPTLEKKDRTKLEDVRLADPGVVGLTGELWTVPRVCQVPATRFDRRFGNVHIWQVLRQLGFSFQRPEGRAQERNESKIAVWKTKPQPRIKEKSARSGAP